MNSTTLQLNGVSTLTDNNLYQELEDFYYYNVVDFLGGPVSSGSATPDNVVEIMNKKFYDNNVIGIFETLYCGDQILCSNETICQ